MKSMKYSFVFFFIIRETEVVMTKNSVVENFEQHKQLTFEECLAGSTCNMI